jgi:hypothetical protein
MTFHHLFVLLYVPIWLGIPYRINTLGDGKDYFKRLVCNNLPIIINIFAFLLLFITLKYEINPVPLPNWTLLNQMQIMTDPNNPNIYDLRYLLCMGSVLLYANAFQIAAGRKK